LSFPTPTRPVRTRFAPSPTGSLHIGGLRTALFNWMFARHYGGAFLLRIEDTDQTRFVPTALQELVEAMHWAGLHWDEGPEVGGQYGPYVQSDRLPLYQEWAKWLIDNDKAYYAYETADELARMRKEQEARKQPPGYNRQHRTLSAEERARFEAEGRKPVVRFKMPLEGKTHCIDAVQDAVTFDNASLQDTVLLKADGFPTYHLAHVVDDHFMQISHVMRAVEWQPSLPLHWNLWEAFGWEKPVYMHLPVMLNPNGKGKISKRNPPVDSQGNIIPVMVHDYIKGGYLPEAVDNFLAITGWSYGDDIEIFSLSDAVKRFDGSRIVSVSAAFPVDKLKWLNGEYIRKVDADDLAGRLRAPLADAGLATDDVTLKQIAPMVQTRIKTLNEVVAMAGFFFKPKFTPASPDAIIQKKMDAATTATALRRSSDVLAGVATFTTQALHDAIQPLTTELSLSNGQLFGLLRVAVTGQTISTPTFETMEVIGKDETLRRLGLALASLDAGQIGA
jgi:glutamyl-tRNA synthetase